jgi:hypothetical protein
LEAVDVNLKEQCVLTEMQEKLNSNLKKYEGDRYKLDGILGLIEAPRRYVFEAHEYEYIL